MAHTIEFFDLNYRFARRIADVTGISLGEALLNYTHLYLSFELGRSFDPNTPAWQQFLVGLEDTHDPVGWIWQTYLAHTANVAPYRPETPFGNFYYVMWENGRVRLHFWRGDHGQSPLQHMFIEQRKSELRALVSHVRAHVPEARTLVGGSWLYNIEAYRRLFPAEYIATARPIEPDPQFIAQWGQLLDYQYHVKPELAARFLEKVSKASSLDELLFSFPYRVMRLECPIDVFYQFYGAN